MYVFCRLLPVLFVLGQTDLGTSLVSVDMFLALLVSVVIASFRTLESTLLLLFAFLGSYYMVHSVDLLTFFVSLEMMNFGFLVLCGLQTNRTINSFSTEATIKYLLLSAFSTGVLLYCFSLLFLTTGVSGLTISLAEESSLLSFGVLCALLFKLGAAPLHLWIVQLFGGVQRSLLLFVSTAPKLALLGF